MARKLNDLLDDIIYECGQVYVRPERIRSIAREIKRKWPELGQTTRRDVAPQPHKENPDDQRLD